MTEYLSPEEILAIHAEIIDRYGGLHGLRDLGLLESAAARPRAGFGEFEAYPSVFDKAAALLHSTIRNHAFVDGNKRTGIVSAVLFLERNGYKVTLSNEEFFELAVDVASAVVDLEVVARLFNDKTEKIL